MGGKVFWLTNEERGKIRKEGRMAEENEREKMQESRRKKGKLY